MTTLFIDHSMGFLIPASEHEATVPKKIKYQGMDPALSLSSGKTFSLML
jgi:hypothetical protein